MGQVFHPEVTRLLRLSARLGRDPLMVQASSGNTSVKLDGTLWIKASGKWLADAENGDLLVPVDLAEAHCRMGNNQEPRTDPLSGAGLSASIETSMHAMLPHRVVLHVHSTNTIAWAVRRDGPERLAERLAGMPWRWVPYVESGLALARAIAGALAEAPNTSILVLGNHGLVVCGESCEEAETRLAEVEERLRVRPRAAAEAKSTLLRRISEISQWRVPDNPELHSLAMDPVSRSILKKGILFPCQAIFLGPETPMLPCSVPFSQAARRFEHWDHWPAFMILEGGGLMVSDRLTAAENAILTGLMHVVQRIEANAPVRYLEEAEVDSVLRYDAHRYRELAEMKTAPALYCN